MPKVSFVIPTWSGDAYLAETLESCRNQTLKDIEIIVVDDCSPDFTEDLMTWYVKQDERIKYHRLEENSGSAVKPRNFGNNLAQSELICVLDHDDLNDPYRAKFCVEYFKRYPETQCLTGAYYECNPDGIPMKKYEPEGITKQLLVDGKYLNREWWDLKEARGWLHSSACYRKSDILRIPYRDMEGETDDYRLLIDWLEAGMVFKCTKKVLAYKRMGEGLERQMDKRMAA